MRLRARMQTRCLAKTFYLGPADRPVTMGASWNSGMVPRILYATLSLWEYIQMQLLLQYAYAQLSRQQLVSGDQGPGPQPARVPPQAAHRPDDHMEEFTAAADVEHQQRQQQREEVDGAPHPYEVTAPEQEGAAVPEEEGDRKKRKRTKEEKEERRRRKRERREERRRERKLRRRQRLQISNDTQQQQQEAAGAAASGDEHARPKKKRRGEMTEDEASAFVQGMIRRMNVAADEDLEAVATKRPGLAKLTLLDEALGEIAKPKWVLWFLREGVCQALERWLTPPPGTTIPNLTVRTRILQLLRRVPIHGTNLQGTELGVRLIALWKSSEETEENRSAIREIVQTVLRPIFGVRAAHGPASALEASEEQNSVPTTRSSQDHKSSDGQSQRPTQRPLLSSSSRRARIPVQAAYSFKVMPKSNVPMPHGDSRDHDGATARLNRVIAQKRAGTTMRRTAFRAQNVSISRSDL